MEPGQGEQEGQGCGSCCASACCNSCTGAWHAWQHTGRVDQRQTGPRSCRERWVKSSSTQAALSQWNPSLLRESGCSPFMMMHAVAAGHSWVAARQQQSAGYPSPGHSGCSSAMEAHLHHQEWMGKGQWHACVRLTRTQDRVLQAPDACEEAAQDVVCKGKRVSSPPGARWTA